MERSTMFFFLKTINDNFSWENSLEYWLTNLDILLTKHDIEWLSQAINGESCAQPTSQKRAPTGFWTPGILFYHWDVNLISATKTDIK